MPKTEIKGYYNSREIQTRFGWNSRQQVSATAKREGWSVRKLGTANFYPEAEIDAYAFARQRTALVRELGWGGRGLFRQKEFDTECPECGEFAAFLPPRTLREVAGWAAYVAKQRAAWPWRCVNGHGQA